MPPHVNVISIIGAYICDIDGIQMYLLMDFCENGSLKVYLKTHWQEFITATREASLNAVLKYISRDTCKVLIADFIFRDHQKKLIPL